MTELREIIAAKWEDNRIVGFELNVMLTEYPEKKYMSLKEIHDEQIQNLTEISLGKRDKADNPVLLLKYQNPETGSRFDHPVIVVKIGNQYEIRLGEKIDNIPQTLLELPKF